MVRSILTITFVVIFLGTVGCSKKVKKAPATTEGKQTEQSMDDRNVPVVAQAEDDYEENSSYDNDDYSSDDPEVTDDTENNASDDDTVTDEASGDDEIYDDDSEDTENSEY